MLRVGFLFHRIKTPETGKLPDRFLLLQDGDINWAGLEDVELTEESAKQIIARFKDQDVQIPIDYEHQTLGGEYSSPSGQAPAAGWIKGLQYVDGEGLYATDVEWTGEAQAQIEKQNYKYISPVIVSDKKSGVVISFHSAALTNKPKTKGQQELLAAADRLAETLNTGVTKMPKPNKAKGKDAAGTLVGARQLIATTLAGQGEEGMPEFPAISDDQKAIGDLIEALKAKGADLADDAPLAEVLAAAIAAIEGGAAPEGEVEGEGEGGEAGSDDSKSDETTETPKPEGDETVEQATFRVKAAAYDKMNPRLAVLEADKQTSRVDGMVAEQVKAGKLLPDDVETVKAARLIAAKEPGAFKTLYGSMVPIAPPGETAYEGVAATPGSIRAKVIRQAASEHDKSKGRCAFGAAKKFHVAAALLDEGLDPLTDGELEKLG